MWAVPINPAELPCYMRLLHEGDLRRCFRDSGSVTYVSTLPAPSPFCVCLVPYVHLAVSDLHLILRSKSQHILVNVREWHFVQHSPSNPSTVIGSNYGLGERVYNERGLRRYCDGAPFLELL